jgi:DNA-binding protein HU-beta
MLPRPPSPVGRDGDERGAIDRDPRPWIGWDGPNLDTTLGSEPARRRPLEGNSVNKGGLVAEVSKRTGLSKADVGRVVDQAIDAIREAVVRGDRVTLADFGTFERKHRNQRIARNPRKPDVPIVVPSRDLPSFTPGKEFREQVLSKRRRA